MSSQRTLGISGKRPQGPPPGDRAQSNLQQLAEAIGVDVDVLLEGNIKDVLAQMSAVGFSVDRYA